MTSPDNHDATALASSSPEHDNFGLDHVRLFVQGQMPAVDRALGKAPACREGGGVALSPDGHGGTLTALAAPGPGVRFVALAQHLANRGICTLFYFQVDNPLVKIADPAFLGRRQADAELSFEGDLRNSPPTRSWAWWSSVDGRPRVIEYSDLPPELADDRPRAHRPARALGREPIAVHLIERSFIERLGCGFGLDFPFHISLSRKCPY